MLQALDGAAARRWGEWAVAALEVDREAIDRINVYPVADNDTGTNMLQTMRSALTALDDSGETELCGVLRELAGGALAGARGNSGMMLSQVLRGIAEEVRGRADLDGPCLARALEQATDRATRAVAVPAQGTILSVLREGSLAARHSRPELAEVVRAATTASIKALDRTTRELPALTAAGVVDAGGRGLVILLDVLHAVVCDGVRLAPDPPEPRGPVSHGDFAGQGGVETAVAGSGYGYEVMYLLSGATAESAAGLRDRLATAGDCVSVAGDGDVAGRGESWAVHVHCDDIGAAIEAGIEVGGVRDIRVTRFADQVATRSDRIPARADPAARARAVLACARGAELAELFRAEGAGVLEADGTRAPGAADVLAAITATGAAHVLVLPNDEMLTEVAEEAAGLAMRRGTEVVVIPTASPVQGLAALAVHDPERRGVDDTVALAEAAAATRRGELVVAERAALTWVGYCEAGDVLGLLDGEVVLIGRDLVTAACDLADRMLTAGGELVTALLGTRSPEALPDALTRHLRRTHPEVELSCYPAGDFAAALLLGVE